MVPTIFESCLPVAVEILGIGVPQCVVFVLVVDMENSESVETQTLPRIFHALEIP